MRLRPLLWHLFPSYLLVILASLLAVTGYSVQMVRGFYLEQTTLGLEARAALLTEQIASRLAAEDFSGLQSLCGRLGRDSGTRITVILPSGLVVADSEEVPVTMDNHADREEIVEALDGNTGSSTRFSRTLRQQMMYVAVPIRTNSILQGVVRVAIPITAIDDALWSILARIGFAGAIVALLAGAVSWVVARRIAKPLAKLKAGAERFARGELTHSLVLEHSQEISALAASMSTMAEELVVRIETASERKRELEAILSSMVESVITIDQEERVLLINEAAANFFNVDRSTILGLPLTEVVRSEPFHTVAREALLGHEVAEQEIPFYTSDEFVCRVQVSALRDDTGMQVGAVIVLNDVTRLHKLERVRREFVSNVSHELRTPITSIKGFVETLIETPPEDPAEMDRFLHIIHKHTNQLNVLIEDILTLSCIEQGDLPIDTILEPVQVIDVIDNAVSACAHLSESKGVAIEVTCAPELEAVLNPALLQQALVNLLDNAVKYSETDGTIRITGGRSDGEVFVSVCDEGSGIAQEHLPRLFERFYRVDKARSKDLGGTGLGLAIVKHIAELHGGRAVVESGLGIGSTFTLFLPGATPSLTLL